MVLLPKGGAPAIPPDAYSTPGEEGSAARPRIADVRPVACQLRPPSALAKTPLRLVAAYRVAPFAFPPDAAGEKAKRRAKLSSGRSGWPTAFHVAAPSRLRQIPRPLLPAAKTRPGDAGSAARAVRAT